MAAISHARTLDVHLSRFSVVQRFQSVSVGVQVFLDVSLLDYCSDRDSSMLISVLYL